jgi:hypothetical protein
VPRPGAPARIASLLLFAACSQPAADSASIDAGLVTVFFPVDESRVHAKAFAGATSAPFVYAAGHPRRSAPIPIQAAAPDGSFEIDLIAEEGDLIELAGARDEDAAERGTPVFLRVPSPANPTVGRFYCCTAANTCQSEFEASEGVPCKELQSGLTRCDEDADCFHLANEVLPIDVARIQVSPPDENGKISLEGTVIPRSLVQVENRALSALGEGMVRWKRTTIADLEGRFRLVDLPGRGDDELVVQLRDLANLRSPPAQLIVPDPMLSTVDVVSVEGWEPIVDGAPGVVALRIAPGGVDGRGICPDSGEAPSTCFTGGLFHSMITSIDMRLSRSGGGPSLGPRPAPIDAMRPHVVGAQGDVRDGPRDFVIVIDMSEGAAMVDAVEQPRRFAAAAELVRRLRDRDRVGLVTIGGGGREVPVGPPAAVIAELASLAEETPSGARDPFAAIGRAAIGLTQAGGERRGNVVVIMTGDVPGSIEDALAQAAAARQSLADRRVDFVTIGVEPGGNLEALRRLARDGDPPGDVVNLESIAALDRAVYDLAHRLVGSFILLYQIDLPDSVGKQDCVELDLTTSIGGTSIATGFRGVVTFEGAAGDPAACN